jgi:integrase
MGRKQQQRGRIGDYWLSRQQGSPFWYRTWFDRSTRQTRRESLRVEDFERAQEQLAQWFTFNVVMRRAAPKDVKVADVFARYYQEHAVHVASVGSIRRHLHLALENIDGDPVVSDLGLRAQEQLVRRLQQIGYAQGAVKRIMTSVKAAIMWAFSGEIITAHPAFLKVADGEPAERVVSIEEIARFWDAAEQSHLQAFTIGLICTLARPTAVLELTRFQCDLMRGVVDLNPTGRTRTKKRRPVVPMAIGFRPWVEAADGLLVSYHGKPVKKINSAWRNARRAAGLPDDFVPYSIRHTMASELRARGVPELEIAGVLGHDMPTFRSTGRYAKYAPDYLGTARTAIDGVLNEIGLAAARPIVPNNPVRATCVQVNNADWPRNLGIIGAGEGIRTLDPNLGKVVLYP